MNTDTLGPRMKAELKNLLGEWRRESQTFVERTGVVGGASHDYAYYSPFGGARSDAPERFKALVERFPQITPENRHEVMAAIRESMMEMQRTRPVVDKRRTQEEDAEITRAREEREAAMRAKAEHEATLRKMNYGLAESAAALKKVLATIWPGTAWSVRSEGYSGGSAVRVRWTDGPREKDVRAVSGVFQSRDFDGMTDMASTRESAEFEGALFTFRSGYVSETRELSTAAFTAAKDWFEGTTGEPMTYGVLPWGFYDRQEDEYPDGVLHRDDEQGTHQTQLIQQIAAHQTREAPKHPPTAETVYRILLGQIGAAEPEASPKGPVSSATMTLNASKGGVELRFPSKPSESILARLKANGWRWSRFSSCWYARDSAAARRLAEEITGAKAESGHGPDVDALYEEQCRVATGA